MDIRLEHTSVKLAERATISVVDGIGARIATVEGRVWITQERDSRDIVLDPGESFAIDRDGTTIIEALADAEVAIDVPGACVDTRPARRNANLTSLAVLGYSRRAHRQRTALAA